MNAYRVTFFFIGLCLLLSACQKVRMDQPVSEGHIQKNMLSNSEKNHIPELAIAAPLLPEPKPLVKEHTHTVIVNQVPVKELIFSLARDSNLNLDIASDVEGTITLNAIERPLNVLLDRIAESANLTYEIKDEVLRIRRDTPVLRYYRIDYINMSRSSKSSASVSTQISSTGEGAAGGSGGQGNNSSTEVVNSSKNGFWNALMENVRVIIAEHNQSSEKNSEGEGTVSQEGGADDKELSENSSESTSGPKNIFLNRESGILGVRATKKQHREISQYINEVLYSSRRQVLIEATIAEVQLKDSYQAGIDWSLLKSELDQSLSVSQTMTDIGLFDRPSFSLQYSGINSDGDSIVSTLSALETFGDVQIMSSPKVMALNNQTALLKVVDNLVYFTVDVTIERGESSDSGSDPGFVTYETEVNTVPVGFVMSVTPYISENDSVTLNVRPTISRVISQARDPNPALAEVGVISEIPVIQVREVDSVLKVNSGDIAVMGGLMQDEIKNNSRGVPLLSKIPILGPLFRYEDDSTSKSELVIFIRPIVIKKASLEVDLEGYQKFLPDNR